MITQTLSLVPAKKAPFSVDWSEPTAVTEDVTKRIQDVIKNFFPTVATGPNGPTTPEEAHAAAAKIGGKVVVKAQVKVGGRGKAGGVKVADNADDAKEKASAILGMDIKGHTVHRVMIAQAAPIAEEYYVSILLDRSNRQYLCMASVAGGMDIEEVAAKTPEKILKEPVSPEVGLQPFQARKLAFALGFNGEQVASAEKIMHALSKVFLEKEASLAEINPLVVTPSGEVMALDAKIVFDDNALFRHPEIEALRDETEEDPAELKAAKSGLSFVSMTGNIGCLVNGAGLAMSTMDIIKYHGGEPANFLDVGGGASKDQVTEAFRILLADPKVEAVLVNIFGGIMKCDTIATAILAAFKEVGFHVPLVVRLEGTNVEAGKKLLADSGLNIVPATGMTEAARKVVEATKSRRKS